jgi:HlyD family secretion protein/adhesin transport system membrane fusion protein
MNGDQKPGAPEDRHDRPRIVLGSRSHRHLAQSVLLDEAVAPRHLRLTIAMTCGALAAFIGWASISQLDEVATAPGQVVPSGAVQVIQHQDGGTVTRIAVAEGEQVAKDQVLLSFDPVETEAELKVSEARHWGLVLRAARLRAQAEPDDKPPDFGDVPDSYQAFAQDQRDILESHRRAARNQEEVVRAQIAQLESDLQRTAEQISSAEREVGIVREVAGIRSGLEKDRIVSRVQSLESQRSLVVQEGDLQRLRAQQRALRANRSEAFSRLKTIASDRRQSTLDELGAASAELAQVSELLVKLRKRLARMELRSPVPGIVQDLKFRTVGGVVPPGAIVMNVVPVEGLLHAEVRIATTDVGHVHPAQRVRVKVLTYDYLRYGTIDGHLASISATSFLDEKGVPYFKGAVRLSRDHLGKAPGDLPVHPGMTVICDIVTDRKTVLQYLIRPVAMALREGLRER